MGGVGDMMNFNLVWFKGAADSPNEDTHALRQLYK